MDLNQRKLTRSEWDSIEISLPEKEINILKLIKQGYNNVNIKINNNVSLITFLKIDFSKNIESYLFNKYLLQYCSKIKKLIKLFNNDFNFGISTNIVRLNSCDRIRLDKNVNIKKEKIYEFILLQQLEHILYYKKSNNTKLFTLHYYTLHRLMKNHICNTNVYVINTCNYILSHYEDSILLQDVILNSKQIIEENKNILKYSDLELYSHQKQVFTCCKEPNPKLILYVAPTGTGKTMTPIGLSEQNRVIFVCAARHVGLALAKSAISVNKKVAFAFGCESAEDIRLHYFTAKEYTKNKKSGGIGKVDNSIGDNVEIMICDIKSYLIAMYYMIAFNRKENIIFYWDEPTITLDYEDHEYHEIIQGIWNENLVPNIVLSSATLPKSQDILDTIQSFKDKFSIMVTDEDDELITIPMIKEILSDDCKKSIPIIDSKGFAISPHYMEEDYKDIIIMSNYIESNLTLLRYLDLNEVSRFIAYVNENNFVSNKCTITNYFESISDINMVSIKVYYITCLKNIIHGTWGAIFIHFKMSREPFILANNDIDTKGNRIIKMKSLNSEHKECGINEEKNIGSSGVYVTTKDAYTLTDGPTIFICEDVEKIAKFCIQQANIPQLVMDDLMKKIDYNNLINEKLSDLEKKIETKKVAIESNLQNSNRSGKCSKKIEREMNDTEGKSEISKFTNELNLLSSMIKPTNLNQMFVPNKYNHLNKWAKNKNISNVFTSNIDDNIITEIMSLNGVEDKWKILLMMGIGVFINHPNITYTEIMKRMATQQKLYMIIASSDYIYGTNYQFCHAYLSRDLNLTQEKIIQAMGRVGRNNIQQTYSVRLRDDNVIKKLFSKEENKMEVLNMNKLLNYH